MQARGGAERPENMPKVSVPGGHICCALLALAPGPPPGSPLALACVQMAIHPGS